MIRNRHLVTACLVTCLAGCADPTPVWQTKLSNFIRHEMSLKEIPDISITIVDGEGYTWSQGFGLTTDEVSGETVYRVASVSKLFTAMAVMQLAEQGRVDLDAPVTRYVPEFQPHNPFDTPITLRHLITHQSGLVREPPVGNYFDDSEPDLETTVKSLNRTRVVIGPETDTKYSNAAVSVAGYVVARIAGRSFEDHVQTALIEKLGMHSTSFSPRADLRAKLGAGYMWRHDTGTLTPAPVFELGIGPAANLYTTTDDLGQFVQMLFSIARNEQPDILSASSINEMWRPQFVTDGTTHGFGLGFYVSSLEDYRTIGHAGMMYGYATSVWALPERELGVAVVANVDATNPVVDRIVRYALSLVLAKNEGTALPDMPRTLPVDSMLARSLDGTYRNGNSRLVLTERNGRLLMDYEGGRYDVRALNDRLINDGRLGYNSIQLAVQGDTLLAGDRAFVRQPAGVPAPPPDDVREYVGEYGWDHNVLYIYEDQGQLHALIEWFFRYPLAPVGRDSFRFPDTGLYMHETLNFVRDAQDRISEANLDGVGFARRSAAPGEGTTFKIVPQLPLDSLFSAAAAAAPPAEPGTFQPPDLVDITEADPTIRLDIRYATGNNFMGMPFYRSAKAFLQRPAAEALVRASKALQTRGYGMIVYDGYRPWSVTKMFWDATPDSLRLFVADPSRGSRHNRGCAVDLGLYDLATGAVVAMPSGYDEFTARAFPDYPGGTAQSRFHRELLRDAMEEVGFTVYDAEWWHFDYQDWRSYPILNAPFESIH